MRILIVDDHEEHIMWLRALYQLADPLASIDTTDDLRTAWSCLITQRYDLWFLRHDINREPNAGGDLVRDVIRHPELQLACCLIAHGANVVNDPHNVNLWVKAGRLGRWLPLMLPETWRLT